MMSIPERFRDPPQPAVIRRKASNVGADTLAACRQLVTCVGIGLATLLLVVECYQYLQSGVYLDHIEGNVVISGWQYLHGALLYETQGDAPRAATCYGPLAYLVEIPALLVFGPTVTSSKLTSMLALLSTVVMMSAYFTRYRALHEGAHGIFLFVAALVLFS